MRREHIDRRTRHTVNLLPDDADAEFGTSPFEQGTREDAEFEGMFERRLADNVEAFGLDRVLRAMVD